MSTLQVTNITTGSVATDLIVQSGNSSGPKVIVASNGQYVVLRGNSTANSIYITSTQVYVNGVIPTRPFKTVTGTIMFSGNVTPAALTSNASAYNPDPTSIAFVIRVSGNSASNTANTAYGQTYEPTIFGLTAGSNGEIVVLSNIGAQKIQLRNEDTVTETTAANRFSLPNHVWLGGYQSIKMQYDGTLARWRPMSSLLIASSHKSRLDKGFFSGGINNSSPAVTVTTADITTYSSETTAAVSGANLPVARAYLSAAGNADKGFFSGGNGVATPGSILVSTAYRTIYSAETTAAVSGANLTQARQGFAAAGNTDKGFFSSVAAPATAAMDRTTYSTETTAAVATAALTTNRTFLAAAGNPDKGFFSSFTPVAADRTTYASETTAAVSGANLTQNRSYLSAAGNADKGFFAGGFVSPASQVTTDRTTYSTETTAAVTGANLSQARDSSGASGDDEKSFFSGGTTNIGGSPAQITADRITYSTETRTAVTGANLSQARYGLAAV